MLLKNERPGIVEASQRLVNGSRGTVIGFSNGSDYEFGDLDDDDEEEDNDDYNGSKTKYPVVQFHCGRRKIIRPQRFESRIVGLGTCVRTAVPLKLAWYVLFLVVAHSFISNFYSQ